MRGGFLGIASVHLTLQCELPALPGHEDKAGFDPLGCGHPGKCTKKVPSLPEECHVLVPCVQWGVVMCCHPRVVCDCASVCIFSMSSSGSRL